VDFRALSPAGPSASLPRSGGGDIPAKPYRVLLVIADQWKEPASTLIAVADRIKEPEIQGLLGIRYLAEHPHSADLRIARPL
jgi:hypothetical protein